MDDVRRQEYAHNFTWKLAVQVLGYDLGIVRIEQVFVLLSYHIFQKLYAIYFIIDYPIHSHALNFDREWLIIWVLFVFLLLFELGAKVVLVHVWDRWWLNSDYFDVIFAFELEGLFVYHLYCLKWVVLHVLFKSMIYYQLVKDVFDKFICNIFDFRHVMQNQVYHPRVFGL